jgi:hypothetical protein
MLFKAGSASLRVSHVSAPHSSSPSHAVAPSIPSTTKPSDAVAKAGAGPGKRAGTGGVDDGVGPFDASAAPGDVGAEKDTRLSGGVPVSEE